MPLDVTAAVAAAASLAPVVRRSSISLLEAPNEAAWRAAVAKRGWHAMYVAPTMFASPLARALTDAGNRVLAARVNDTRPLIYELPPFNVAIANYFRSMGVNQEKVAGDLVEWRDKVKEEVGSDIGKMLLYAALILGGFYVLGESVKAPRSYAYARR